MSVHEQELDSLRRELKDALPRWREMELETDLWPRMLRRMEVPPARFGWLESVLLALAAALIVVFPELLPVMLYHL